jgi:hypothetical protein
MPVRRRSAATCFVFRSSDVIATLFSIFARQIAPTGRDEIAIEAATATIGRRTATAAVTRRTRAIAPRWTALVGFSCSATDNTGYRSIKTPPRLRTATVGPTIVLLQRSDKRLSCLKKRDYRDDDPARFPSFLRSTSSPFDSSLFTVRFCKSQIDHSIARARH